MLRIVYKKRAKKYIDKISKEVKLKIKLKIEELACDSQNLDVKKLCGELEDFQRIRYRDYRIIFQKFDDRIEIVAIGPRKEIYDELKRLV